MRVLIEKKKKKIYETIKNYHFGSYESHYFLNFLLTNELFLKNINLTKQPKSQQYIIMNSNCSNGHPPFEFYNGKGIYLDVRTAISFIISNEFNIDLVINTRDGIIVLEDEKNQQNIDKLIAEIFLDKVLNKKRVEKINKEIDKALDNRDEEKFIELAREKSELEDMK